MPRPQPRQTPRLTLSTILCGGLALLLTACGPVQAISQSSGQTGSISTTPATSQSAPAAVSVPATTAPATIAGETGANSSVKQTVTRPDGWSEASHGDDAAPNYAVVFPENEVKQLTITISPDEWATMQANMTELLGEKGARRGGPGGGPGGMGVPGQQPAADGAQPGAVADGQPPMPPDGAMPGGPDGGPGGATDMTPENPVWVAATIGFDGQTWNNVGVRYKGNSSLMSSWGSDTLKLPFKLDFDELEDAHPEIKNQRFYGFQQLSLGNNFGDASLMRDTVAYDLLEEAGLVAAHTAFYDVVLDYGQGPVNLGIYTAVEVIDDTVIGQAFDDDSGNIYEADGRAASLAAGTLDQIEESFQKENNKTSDWSDVERLYATLHDEARTTDAAAWRADLESVFDVDTFLEWLALSGEMQHWDTYGAMSHNYYLYNNPETGKLTWISWDHNMVLGSSGGPGGPGAGDQPGALAAPAAAQPAVGMAPQTIGEALATDGQQVGEQPATGANQQRGGRGMGAGMGGRMNVSLDKQTVDANWPLIRFLLDDPTYYAKYVGYVQSTSAEVFVPERLAARYQAMAEMLAPYADRDGTRAQFDTAVQELTTRTFERSQAVTDFLKKATVQTPQG